MGVSAISQVGDLYSQNSSDLTDYQRLLDSDQPATRRGLICSEDDRIRRAVIQQLICHFTLNFSELEKAFTISFRDYFADAWPHLLCMANDGLIALSDGAIEVRPAGRLLVRSVCMVFDAYLTRQNRQQFSRVI